MKKGTVYKMLLSALVMLLLLGLCSCGEEKGETVKLEIDYEDMTYVGTSLKDFSALFDEQDVADPYNGKYDFPLSQLPLYDADGNGDITDNDRAHIYEVTVDLKCEHYITCIYAFSPDSDSQFTIEYGTPFRYESATEVKCEALGWKKIDIDTKARYVNLKLVNGNSPTELIFYGYETGERDPINTEAHDYRDMGYLLGINGNQNDAAKVKPLLCANYYRDYINWAWCYSFQKYPGICTDYGNLMSACYTLDYPFLNKYDVDPVPCFMYTNSFPGFEGEDTQTPSTYAMYGELMYQTAVRFGNNPANTLSNVKVLGNRPRFNMNCIRWIEAGNEPNGEGNDGFSPYELAALTSTAYDGHENTVTVATGSGVGVKNGDPNIKLAMAGLAGVGVRYIQAMTFWLENNRTDGKIAMDAFNVHTYCKKLIEYNGYQVYVGVCPEIGEITKYVAQLTAFRDKYYPDTEVWVTEFGWDTNTSYETENACHPYGPFSAREIQAMWLVRAYFMFAGVGVDRAAMYMAADIGDEATSTGKYGTSGVYTVKGEYKESFYYLSTIRNTMGDMHFAEIIDSGNENVWIYRFENGEGKSCYALWCPTMDDVRVDGFKLNIDGNTATMVEFANKEESGVSSELSVSNGTVTVNVSERPILIFSKNK